MLRQILRFVFGIGSHLSGEAAWIVKGQTVRILALDKAINRVSDYGKVCDVGRETITVCVSTLQTTCRYTLNRREVETL